MSGDVKPDQAATVRVGEQLRLGRERLGLELSAIAAEQHLRPSVIQAIENGDYSKVDSELFLKGYVRAYARQIGLDADSVIADLDRELEPARQQREREQQANPLVSIERAKRRKRQLAKILAILLVIAVGAYLIVGYLAEQEVGSDLAPMSGTESASDLVVPEESQPSIRPEQEDQMTGSVTSDGVVDPETVTADALPDDARPEDLSADQQPVMIQSSEPVPEPEPEQVVAAEVTEGRLQMTFSDDCWVQVTDAGGNRLVSSRRRSGDLLDVTGEAPLRVVIGAVSAVESIQFQGDALNIGDLRVVNNRSEFTLEL
ncbi:RodZ domain-containing protein [Marinobacter sp.]|uniref:RodZ domain-containing protein n=1 Tax=Marinobacter sp. TaxID=50741 RepID=UPI0019ED774C|nr:RodZ domain-containing protein [Marinobacter sp.]MBE0485104.1 DUF4115 domain-containing protein [Marinobacter sp.]